MNILKRGFWDDRQTKRFECGLCGSIFEATKDEYKGTDQLGQIHDNLPPYNCKCPICGRTVYTR